MKINIKNKEYDAVEAKEITYFPNATDAITLDGITYNLTPTNPLQEELERDFREWARDWRQNNPRGDVITFTISAKEKVSSLIRKALAV